MSPQTTNFDFAQQEDVSKQRWMAWLISTLVDLREFYLTSLCAIVTTCFTLYAEGQDEILHVGIVVSRKPMILTLAHNRQETRLLTAQYNASGLLDVLVHPSPAVMILACAVLGCSISSFIFRHRRQDQYQIIVFTILIACAATVGGALSSSLNLILLGFIPCSLSFAMLLSGTGHSLARFLRSRSCQALVVDEKEQSGSKA